MSTQAALHVLALNSGSSSLKFGLFRVDASVCEPFLTGEASALGTAAATFRARDASAHEIVFESMASSDPAAPIQRIVTLLAQLKAPRPAAIGHRIVHGGPLLTRHCLIDAAVLARLTATAAFAPLHSAPALAIVEFARECFRDVPQVACLDTAFHAELPQVAQVLPIPKSLRLEGLRRYGFHGLSCASIMRQLAQELPRERCERVVIAHLGSGASITAVKDGKSIDTTMGLTPSGGVIMATRSGDIDPGLLIYLVREKRFDAAMLADLVDHRSGLMGLSGVSSDLRILSQVAAVNADARLAMDVFCSSVRKHLAGMIATLEGVDVLVFTGGIGQHDAQTRARICGGLSWAGIRIDAVRNQAATNPISTAASSCAVYVFASNEEQQIARDTWALVGARLT